MVVLAVIALLMMLCGISGLRWPQARESSTLRDLKGNRVVLDAGESAPPEASAVPDSGQRFVVESVGLDVPLGEVSAVRGQVTPPGFTSAYLVRNEGVGLRDASRGTVFVVMHSLRNGGVGPGNYLFDLSSGRPSVADGAEITVGSRTYRVSSSATIAKSRLAQAQDLWTNEPGRLVVITCLQRPAGGPSLANIILIAQLES